MNCNQSLLQYEHPHSLAAQVHLSELEPDTSASGPRAFTSKPVRKPAGNEYEYIRTRFPTGIRRVRVRVTLHEFIRVQKIGIAFS